ncbi:MAG: hypothetical protein ABSH53_23530 [Holophaga sp.]
MATNLPSCPEHYFSRTPWRTLWGIAPTGPIHLGYAAYLLLLRWLRARGSVPVVLIADYHGYLDAGKAAWPRLAALSNEYARTVTRAGLGDSLVFTREAYARPGYLEALFRLSPAVGLDKALRTGATTLGFGRSASSLSEALYVATQVIDPWFFGCDAVLCGADERPIYDFGLELLAREWQFHCKGVFLPMCPGLISADMHASDPPANRMDLFLPLDQVRGRLEQVAALAPGQFLRLSEYSRTVLCPLAVALGASVRVECGSPPSTVDPVVDAIGAAQEMLQGRGIHD